MSDARTYVIILPISPAQADMAGMPAEIFERAVVAVGLEGSPTWPLSATEAALTAARIEGVREGLERAATYAEGIGYAGESIATGIRDLALAKELTP